MTLIVANREMLRTYELDLSARCRRRAICTRSGGSFRCALVI